MVRSFYCLLFESEERQGEDFLPYYGLNQLILDRLAFPRVIPMCPLSYFGSVVSMGFPPHFFALPPFNPLIREAVAFFSLLIEPSATALGFFVFIVFSKHY